MTPLEPGPGAHEAQEAHVSGDASRQLPALVALAAVAALLIGISVRAYLSTSVPAADIGVHALYWTFGVVVPGVLVHKAARGTLGSWVADLAMGAATGLCLELGAWAVASSLNARAWLVAWPVLTLLVLAFRRTRRRVLALPRANWPWWTVAGLGVVAALVVRQLDRTYLNSYDLLPGARSYYVDLPWHLGLAQEATRALPLLTPQLVEEGPIKYSWFVHAHVAAGSLITHIDVTVLMLRLWIIPVAVVGIAATAVLVQRLSGRAWGGLLAAALFVALQTVPFWQVMVPRWDSSNPLSPTHAFSVVISLLFVDVAADVVRTGWRIGVGPLLLTALSGLAVTGTKSSTMAILLCGVGLAALASLWLGRNRTVAWALSGVALGLELFALVLVTGGGYGTGIQLFSALGILPQYTNIVGTNTFDSRLLPGLFAAETLPWLPVALLASVAMLYGRLVSFLAVPFFGPLRRDAAAWLLAGICLSSWVPFFVVGHRGYSEYYFVRGALPFGAALLAWIVVVVAGDRTRHARALALGLAVAALASIPVAVWANAQPNPARGKEAWVPATQSFAAQASAYLALVLVLLGAAWLFGRRDRLAVLRPLLVGLVVGPTLASTLTFPFVGPSDQARRRESSARPALLAESEAALWMRRHIPDLDVVATNATCLSGKGMRCDARRWWVSGLGGRRALLDGWWYTAQGANGRFDNVELYTFNMALFDAPTPDRLAAAWRRGVRWLVAERGEFVAVSPRLNALADERYRNQRVTIYELRAPADVRSRLTP